MESTSNVYIVSEYQRGGELFDKIVASTRLNEKSAYKYFAQVTTGVQFLHSKGIVHRDLKVKEMRKGQNKHSRSRCMKEETIDDAPFRGFAENYSCLNI